MLAGATPLELVKRRMKLMDKAEKDHAEELVAVSMSQRVLFFLAWFLVMRCVVGGVEEVGGHRGGPDGQGPTPHSLLMPLSARDACLVV